MLHLSEFVCTLRSSVLVVFNNFLLTDATDRSNVSSDQKRLFKPIPPFIFREYFLENYHFFLVPSYLELIDILLWTPPHSM